MLSIPTTHLFFLLMFIYLRGVGILVLSMCCPLSIFLPCGLLFPCFISVFLFSSCLFLLISKIFYKWLGMQMAKRLCNVDLVRLFYYVYCCIEYLKLAFGMRQVLSKFSLLFESQSVVGIFEERLSSMSYMFNWHSLKSNTFFMDCCFWLSVDIFLND